MDASLVPAADTDVESGVADDLPVDKEFWDACWTLDDEWQPRISRPRASIRRRPATATVHEVYPL